MYDISLNNMKVSLPCVEISCNFCYVCFFSAKQLCLLMIYMKCGRDLPKLLMKLSIKLEELTYNKTSDCMASWATIYSRGYHLPLKSEPLYTQRPTLQDQEPIEVLWYNSSAPGLISKVGQFCCIPRHYWSFKGRVAKFGICIGWWPDQAIIANKLIFQLRF